MAAVGSEGQPPVFYMLQRGLLQLRDAPPPFARPPDDHGSVQDGGGRLTDASAGEPRTCRTGCLDSFLRLSCVHEKPLLRPPNEHLSRILGSLQWPLSPPCHPRITHLISSAVAHPGGGSAIIDDALPPEVLDRLDRRAGHGVSGVVCVHSRRRTSGRNLTYRAAAAPNPPRERAATRDFVPATPRRRPTPAPPPLVGPTVTTVTYITSVTPPPRTLRTNPARPAAPAASSGRCRSRRVTR